MSVLTETMERLDKEGKFKQSHLVLFNVALAEHEEEIRNKAIDEFEELLREKVESFQTEINGYKADVLTLDYFMEFVDEIAEEMRGGVSK